MKAVVEIKNKQYLVAEGDFIRTDFLNKKKKEELEFNNIKLILDGDKIISDVKGVKIIGRVVAEGKTKKLKVFKYRRRKDSRTMKGHRQKYSLIKIEKIVK